MRAAAVLALVLLAGCPAHVTRGLYSKAQDHYAFGTVQRCERGAEAVAAFDALAPIVVDELHRAGLCERPATVLDELTSWDGPNVHLCLIEQPEPCLGRGQLVAGCAGSGGLIVSRWSPPICAPGVTVKCAASHDQQKDTLWRTFAHEAIELLLTRCSHYTASHSPAAKAAEQRAWERWRKP